MKTEITTLLQDTLRR